MRLTASRASITSSGGAALDAIQQEDPTLDLNFEENKTLTDDVSGNNLITFSRASIGTYVDSDGLIKTTPVNLLIRSEEFDNAVWQNTGSPVIQANAAVAPDGTQSAEIVSYKNVVVYQDQGTATQGVTYTGSIYLKGNSDQTLKLRVVSTQASDSQEISVTTEWQRFMVTRTATNSTDPLRLLIEGRDGFVAPLPVDFELYMWGAQLEANASFPTSYIPTGATISGAPRFDHDPATGESLGLLIEESRTNLLTYSEEFDQWTVGSNSTVTPNAVTAPDGTLTADRVFSPATGGTFVANGTITAGTTYTASVYAKAVTPGTNDKFTFNVGGGSGNASSQFTATAEWQRFTFTVTPSTVTAGLDNLFINNEGDGFISDIYLWGAQLEANASFPTSYIPTFGQTGGVTRTPDIATIEGTNFSSWYNQSEGTIFSDVSPLSADSGRAYVFSDGTENQRIGHSTNASNNFALFIRSGSTTTSLASSVSGLPKPLKAGIAYKSGSSRGVFDGVLKTLSSTTQVPNSIDQLSLGSQNFSAEGYLNGHISRIAYFPPRKTDQESIDLTI